MTQTMELHISFKKPDNLTLALKRQERIRIFAKGRFQLNKAPLDEGILRAIDIFLKRNRIDALSIKTVHVNGSVDEDGLAYKLFAAIGAAVKSFEKSAIIK